MEPQDHPETPAPAAPKSWLQRCVTALSLFLLAVTTCAVGLWWMQGKAAGPQDASKSWLRTYAHPANLMLWIGGSKETVESLSRKATWQNEQVMQSMRYQADRDLRKVQWQLQDIDRQWGVPYRPQSRPPGRR